MASQETVSLIETITVTVNQEIELGHIVKWKGKDWNVVEITREGNKNKLLIHSSVSSSEYYFSLHPCLNLAIK